MPQIYVLNVPEFEPIIRILSAVDGVTTRETGDYLTATSNSEIILSRAAAGVGHAVWFGLLTGGIDGTVVEFSDDRLQLAS